MAKSENDLQHFVKSEIKDLGSNVTGALLFLKRLDRLNLKCFHLERRYLDIGIVFSEELQLLKDK